MTDESWWSWQAEMKLFMAGNADQKFCFDPFNSSKGIQCRDIHIG